MQSGLTFAAWLKRKRKEQGLTQETLAGLAGCSTIYLKKIEGGQRHPTRQVVEALLDALRVPKASWPMYVELAFAEPPVSPSRSRTNLPAPLTSFIGRHNEKAAINNLLQRTTARLVTLTGPGGVGKTRLALEVAAGLDGVGDGVYFVDLAPIADPLLVPNAIMMALALSDEAGHTPLETITTHLRTQSAFLVLDNCEHLVEACSRVAHYLLIHCPKLRILAASREALNISGEAIYPVPPLALPYPNVLPPADSLSQYDAVMLLIQRAAAVQPQFAITDANSPAVTQICYRLDGLPLAIELAAARMRVFSPEQIAARLDDRFRLLAGGSRAALPRHQTLRATIEWSHSLLSEAERVLLRRLAVFAGGWTLDAAEQVCGGDGLDTYDILEALAQLVSKSLVMAEVRDGEARYRMLETIREYSREKLAEAGEQWALRTRHLEFFAVWTELGRSMLHSPEQRRWLNSFEEEQDNIRAALAWALEDREIEKGMQIIGALHWFWWSKGYWSEARDWALQFLAQPEAQARTLGRAQALDVAGDCIGELGDFVTYEVYCRESIAIARELGDEGKWLAAYQLIDIAYISGAAGDGSEARGALEEGLRLMEGARSRDRWIVGWLHDQLGRTFTRLEDYARAFEHFEQSLRIFRAIGDRYMSIQPLGGLGVLLAEQGRFAEGKRYAEESLAIKRELGDRKETSIALRDLGRIACLQGEYAEAEAALEEALVLSRELHWQIGLADILSSLAYAEQALGDTERALDLYREVLSLSVTYKNILGHALDGLAQLEASRGNFEASARLFGAATAREPLKTLQTHLMRPGHEHWMQVTRAALGEATFAALEEVGRAMTSEEAVAYAAVVALSTDEGTDKRIV
ncbi:MAG: tetratricopeptide repeat protein [Anaerolineae bacterium]